MCLSKSFAISVQAFAVMSTHIRVVVHIDPLVPVRWPDEEVAHRWLNAFSGGSPDSRAFYQKVRALAGYRATSQSRGRGSWAMPGTALQESGLA